MESGWNVWVWLVGVVSRRWVWLVGVGGIYAGVLKISLAGANNSVPTTGLTPCI